MGPMPYKDPAKKRAHNQKWMKDRRKDPEFADRQNQASKDSRRRQTEAIHRMLGGVCGCCGSSEQLEIDHINGDGGLCREAAGGRTQHKTQVLHDLALGYNTYNVQLICHSCHVGKGEHGGKPAKMTQ